MEQILLNGEQFRQLVTGNAVSLGCCEIKLGNFDFHIMQVAQIPAAKNTAKRRPHLIKSPK